MAGQVSTWRDLPRLHNHASLPGNPAERQQGGSLPDAKPWLMPYTLHPQTPPKLALTALPLTPLQGAAFTNLCEDRCLIGIQVCLLHELTSSSAVQWLPLIYKTPGQRPVALQTGEQVTQQLKRQRSM